MHFTSKFLRCEVLRICCFCMERKIQIESIERKNFLYHILKIAPSTMMRWYLIGYAYSYVFKYVYPVDI